MLSRYFRWPLRIAVFGLSVFGAIAAVFAALLAVPLHQPPELKSITSGVRKVDVSDLPALQRFQARDGTDLAYRVYDPAGTPDQRIALLVHGSAGNSINMHAVGKALAQSGIRAVAVDMRGHGRSGTRGDIAYLGQMDDDLADTVQHLRKSWPEAPLMLVGHSAGGGFVLRTAGSANGDLFQRFVLLAPYLSPRAATTRPNSGDAGWASPDIPRIIGINLLHRIGIACCDHLPVVAFALPAASALHATRRYSFALLSNFGTGFDHHPYLDRVNRPVTVISGANDELMISERYAGEMRRPGLDAKSIVVPDVDHMGILSAPAALQSIVSALRATNGA